MSTANSILCCSEESPSSMSNFTAHVRLFTALTLTSCRIWTKAVESDVHVWLSSYRVRIRDREAPTRFELRVDLGCTLAQLSHGEEII